MKKIPKLFYLIAFLFSSVFSFFSYSSDGILRKAFNTLGIGQKDQKKEKLSSEENLLWKNLLDHTTSEFWSEGNHRPDSGLLILLKNPTVANAKNWLLRMETKRKVSLKVQEVIQIAQKELIEKKELEDVYSEKAYLDWLLGSEKKQQNRTTALSSSRVYYFFFSPNCEKSKSLANKLVGIKNLYPIQVNFSPLLNFDSLEKSQYATEEVLGKYLGGYKKVPVLVVLDTKNLTATRFFGDLSKEEINKILNEHTKRSGR